jgi:hypothetical protein
LWSVLAATGPRAAGQDPVAAFPDSEFDFGKVARGTLIEHDFVVRNVGPGLLRISRVQATAPLELISPPEEIGPRAEAALRVRLRTANISGPLQGEILISLNDPALPQCRLSLRGEVYPLIELASATDPAVFGSTVSGFRGEAKRASLDIVSHEPEPLRVIKVEHPKDRFDSQLETLKEGKHYRLTLTLNPDGLAGKHTENVKVTTSSNNITVFEFGVSTELKERVSATPEQVNFGALPIRLLRDEPRLIRRLTKTVIVRRDGRPDFRAEFRSELPFVDVKCQPGASGTSYEVQIRLIPEYLQVGPIMGHIFVETNDPDVPTLKIPVAGVITDQ